MGSGRLIPTFVALALLSLGQVSHADAGWGFGHGWGWRTGGLNLENGYDVNTVVSVTGRVADQVVRDDRHVVVELRTGEETVHLVLGPKWYWENRRIPLRPNDLVTARGSKALDEDGAAYILIQKVTNQTTGAEIVLRGDGGKPVWSGGGRHGKNSRSR